MICAPGAAPTASCRGLPSWDLPRGETVGVAAGVETALVGEKMFGGEEPLAAGLSPGGSAPLITYVVSVLSGVFWSPVRRRLSKTRSSDSSVRFLFPPRGTVAPLCRLCATWEDGSSPFSMLRRRLFVCSTVIEITGFGCVLGLEDPFPRPPLIAANLVISRNTLEPERHYTVTEGRRQVYGRC